MYILIYIIIMSLTAIFASNLDAIYHLRMTPQSFIPASKQLKKSQ